MQVPIPSVRFVSLDKGHNAKCTQEYPCAAGSVTEGFGTCCHKTGTLFCLHRKSHSKILLKGAERRVPMPLPLQRERHGQLRLPSNGILISASLCTGTAQVIEQVQKGRLANISHINHGKKTLRCQQTMDKQGQMG